MGKGLIHLGFAAAAAEILPKFQPERVLSPGAGRPVRAILNNIAFGKRLPPASNAIAGHRRHPRCHAECYDHSYLYVPRHSRLDLCAAKLDFVSGLGPCDGARARGGGPRYLITDLGQFDWKNGSMRLTSICIRMCRVETESSARPPLSLDIAEDLRRNPTPPDDEDLRLLREEIDPLDTRKLETLGGGARKALLREILRREGSR